MRFTILGLTGLAILTTMTVLLRSRGMSEPVPPSIDTNYLLGDVVPDLPLVDLDGNRTTLSAYGDGKAMIVAGRDALCPVTRRYGPTTARLERDYAKDGIRFLFVNVSPLDTEEMMRADISRYNLQGLYVHDPEWVIARSLGMITTAEVFLIDADGRLQYRGAIDDQYGIRFTKPSPRAAYLRDAVQELRANETVSVASTLPEGCYLASDVRHTVASMTDSLESVGSF